MKSYWLTFRKVLTSMLERPMWLMLILSLCIMSTVYANRTVWDLPVAVIDQDHSTASRQLIRQLDATPKIAIQTYDSLDEAKRDLGWRKLFAVIIMPVDLEKKILNGKNIEIPVFGDATNRLANGQIQQDVVAAYQQLLGQYNTSLLMRSGFSERQAQVIMMPIQSQTLDVFNPGISFAAIIFPGLLVMLLQHSLLIACVRVSIVLKGTPGGKPSLPVYLGAIGPVADLAVPVDCVICAVALGFGLSTDCDDPRDLAADLPVPACGAWARQAGNRMLAQRGNDLPDAVVYHHPGVLPFWHYLAAASDAAVGQGDFIDDPFNLGDQSHCWRESDGAIAA